MFILIEYIQFRIKFFSIYMSTTHDCFHYNKTDSWNDITSANFNSTKVHEDKIFGQEDVLQFFSELSKNYKYAKSPNSLGTLIEHVI